MPLPAFTVTRSRPLVVSALGAGQIAAWGSTYYLLAVLARPIADDTGWPLPWVVGGFSLALLVSGLLSPFVGRTVERHGGRPVLAGSSVVLAVGLTGVAFAGSLPAYLAAWALLGAGMAAGLYEASFSTLGWLYGTRARAAISQLTLWGGFASTVSWPVSTLLVERLGWRDTCLAYAGFQLAAALPVYLLVLRGTAHARTATPPAHVAEPAPPLALDPRLATALVALSLTVAAAISSTLSVHLLGVLQQQGVALGAAVALGALVGPSQVGARLIEMLLGRRLHPIWVLIAATALVATGMLLLLVGSGTVLPVAMLCYGAGLGITSIVRGALPLALFGGNGYAARLGRISMPVLLVQSVAPPAAALLLEQSGARPLLLVLAVLAIGNVVLALLLRRSLRL